MALWIPDTARPVELTPAFFCRICKAEFTERERFQYQHHVVRCSEENHDSLDAQREGFRKWQEHVDPEWESWNREREADGIDPLEQFRRKPKNSVKRPSES